MTPIKSKANKTELVTSTIFFDIFYVPNGTDMLNFDLFVYLGKLTKR